MMNNIYTHTRNVNILDVLFVLNGSYIEENISLQSETTPELQMNSRLKA